MKKSPVNQVKHMLTGVFAGGNIASLLLLYACCMTTWVDPALHPRVSVVGILFPFLLLANVAFVPFWLIFKKKLVIIPVLGMLLCSSFILDYFPISFPAKDVQNDSTLRVVSWNTNGFGCHGDSGWCEVTRYLIQSEADIICLVENEAGAPRKEELNQWAKQNNYYHSSDCPVRELYSRYPILDSETIAMESETNNGAINYRILMGEDTVNVILVHLESNRFSPEEKDEYQGFVKSRERNAVEQGSRMILSKLAVGARRRGPQVDVLTQYLSQLQGQSVILCGDFNDTPISYSYQQVDRHLESAFRHSGNGIGVTYNQAFFWVRIDHFFYSDDWTSVSAKVDESTDVSDHYPLLVTLKKREK